MPPPPEPEPEPGPEPEPQDNLIVLSKQTSGSQRATMGLLRLEDGGAAGYMMRSLALLALALSGHAAVG